MLSWTYLLVKWETFGSDFAKLKPQCIFYQKFKYTKRTVSTLPDIYICGGRYLSISSMFPANRANNQTLHKSQTRQ